MPRVQRTPPSRTTETDDKCREQPEPDIKAPTATGSESSMVRSKRPRTAVSPGNDDECPTESDLVELDQDMLNIIRKEIRSAIAAEFTSAVKSCLRTELNDIRQDLALLRDLNNSVQFISEQFDQMKKELDSNKEKIVKLKSENEALINDIRDISFRLNALEQYTRQENVELSGIPENKSENIVKTVMQLSKVVSLNLQENDVLSAFRIRKLDATSSRPRSIVVKLRSTRIRDDLLASVVKFNKANSTKEKLNSHHLGYGGTKQPIFVSEHLSPLNKRIHAATRKAASEKSYKYVWVRDGRILIRKDEKSPAKQITSLEAIARL